MGETVKRKRAEALSAPVPHAISPPTIALSDSMDVEKAPDPSGNTLVKMGREDLANIAELAQSLEVHGTIRLNTGTILAMQSTLIALLTEVRKRVTDADQPVDTDQLLKAASSLAKVGNTIAKLANEQRIQTRPQPTITPKRHSSGFAPGQKIVDVTPYKPNETS